MKFDVVVDVDDVVVVAAAVVDDLTYIEILDYVGGAVADGDGAVVAVAVDDDVDVAKLNWHL